MKERIDIVVDEARIAQNDEKQELLRRTRAFEPTDRVPVVINNNQWTDLAARGRTTADYVRSPKDNLREQILNKKWRLENIDDDSVIPTKGLSFSPDLGCLRGTEFDMEIVWPENQPPKATHPLREVEEIDALPLPDPDNALNGRRIEWFRAMRACRDDFDVRLNGKPLEIGVTISHPGGPIPAAFALAGANLFLWMAEDPDRIHKLMDLVTESHMRCVAYMDDLAGRPRVHATGLGYDTAEMISLRMFREFVVPYCNRIYERYPGPRGFHNCGKNEHLLESFRDDLQVSSHNGFGFCVDVDRLAETMSGHVLLSGGPNPVLVRDGTPDQIQDACRVYLEKLGPKGGFTLSLGGGTAAHTPIENYQAMVDCARNVAVCA